ncbi:hypothetical protein SDC9_192186 [bioreactor metagenome]|uniref:Uncharacterized protein n=1 Tax=bioreactor metagenome TaxID=1076179 RepID=A0A645HZZ4_9ZZZZ
MVAQHLHLGVLGRIAHLDPGHEAVTLGLGEGIGALHLDRVLGGDDHERAGELVRGAVGRHLPLLHRLQHG